MVVLGWVFLGGEGVFCFVGVFWGVGGCILLFVFCYYFFNYYFYIYLFFK